MGTNNCEFTGLSQSTTSLVIRILSFQIRALHSSTQYRKFIIFWLRNRMYRNDRDDSPDYRPPPGPSSRRRARSPSPSYSPRGRGYHDGRDSPRGHESYRRREPTPDTWRSDSRDYKRPRSRSRSARSNSRSPSREQKLSSFLARYEDDLKSLFCKQCQIPFNDRER